MKRILVSLMLVLTLVMSSLCCVNAAVGDLNWYKGKFLSTDPTLNGNAEEVRVPVEIKVKLNSAPAVDYVSSLSTNAGTLVDFIAELDMTRVKTLVSLGVSTVGDYYNSIKDRSVTGQFIINANWEGILKVTGSNPLDTGNMEGFKFYDGSGNEILNNTLFVEAADSRVETINNGEVVGVTATISVAGGTTVEDVLALPDKITLEHSGFEVVGFGNVSGSFTVENLSQIENGTYTKLGFDDGGRYVKYNFVVTPATISAYYSGGGIPVTNYVLKYESNGGTSYAAETYSKGKEVKINKVPERDGYVFDGWYEDANFTKEITSLKMTGNTTIYAKWVKERHPVPEMLNGEDHFAYVIGYPDGTVRPNDNITRAEVTTIFFRLLKDEIRDANLTAENVFTDVNEGDWHNIAVSTMAKLGIVNGREEDKFVPDDFITRAEFTAICARFDDAEIAYTGKLTDIDEHWAEEYIKRASSYGWIEGYNDDTFRPDNFITRAEAMTLINRVLNRILKNADALLHESMIKWSDNLDVSAWYYTAVQEATHSTEYNRPNSLYKEWTEIIENRDWSEYQK